MAPQQMQVRLRIGIGDFVKVFLNGAAVSPGKITLKKGPNGLMLKVGDHEGAGRYPAALRSRTDLLPKAFALS